MKLDRVKYSAFLLVIFCIFSTSHVFADWRKGARHPTPVGFDKYIVYIADGLYDPTKPHPNPEITGCDISTFCDAEYFQKVLMGRDDAEIATLEQEAKDYFLTRFGLDVDDPKNEGRIAFRSFMVDPRVNYHVVSASGERVPSRGWPVIFGGWIILVTDPNGIALAGDFAGTTTPVNGQFIFGENYIQTKKKKKYRYRYDGSVYPSWHQHSKSEPIIIKYRSQRPPVVPTSDAPLGVRDNIVVFQLETMNDDYGSGLSRGRGEILPTPDGLFKFNIVNVITFPGLSDRPASE